ncbi:hypothetical protein ERFG_04159 [Escherichia coli TW10509]|nr:hypothetical protein ERFG_04159 [Escherichia coli TW10509]
MSSWLAMLQDAAEMFVFLAVELSLLFMVISAGVSLIRQKVPDHKIQQMMGARKGRGYLLAALLGAVTPFCSCSTIPMLRGLLSAKAGFGPTLTFLFVSPLLNPIIVGLMWVTFGWKVTLLYAIIAAGVSVLASIILDSLRFERHIIASKSSSANCCSPAKTSPGTTYTPIKVSCCSPAAKAIEKPVVNCCSTKAVVSINPIKLATKDALQQFKDVLPYLFGFAPIFPDICYHLTHYKPAAADIPVASDNPAHYADAIRYNARTPLQGSLLPLTRLVWA